MSKPKEVKPIDIIVSTYWPTKIIKSIKIDDPNESYNQCITLSASDARYVYEQLKVIFEEAK